MAEHQQIRPNNDPTTGDEGESQQLDLLAVILPEVLSAFQKLNADGRRRLLSTVATFFDIEPTQSQPSASALRGRSAFSEDRSMSPKEFLRQKQPRTDVERVACLAYYLTHYRDIPQFKTLDISKLNTEAAQTKFANAAQAVNNASSYGYLTAATKGNKQITAGGEAFVEALPDRDAARNAMAHSRPRKRRSKVNVSSKNASSQSDDVEENVD